MTNLPMNKLIDEVNNELSVAINKFSNLAPARRKYVVFIKCWR